MYNLVSLLVALVSVCGASRSSNVLSVLNGRIIGGDDTNISSRPYQVTLLLHDKHHCGGVIYNENIIITAAHCLINVPPSKLKVRAGSSFWNKGGSLIQVAGFQLHENFNAGNLANDIALVRLADGLTFNSRVKPTPLAVTVPVDGAAATVSGWGLTGKTTNFPDMFPLKSADVIIIGRDACASATYNYGSSIHLSMICAQDAGKDACIGDSGGPLVSNGKLVGIVSWGKGCAKEKYPGVYADVAHFNDWIENTAKQMK
uniref:Peptidase S1 domain-containing protein n=1 Tax=Glossina morsitans morsitans TaxID=37546 RepID=A0A1B0G0C0_GLOMM